MLTVFEGMVAWKIFAIIGVVLMIAEIFVSGFVLLPIGMGFLLAAAASLVIHDWFALLGLLAFFEITMFWFFQTYLKKLNAKTRAYTNAEGMIGKECTVIEAIPKGGAGYVKLYGDQWQALSSVGGSIAVGERVVITRTEGNKVYVEPIN